MIIDDVLLEKIGKLAKLQFELEEKEKIKKDLNEMLAFIEKLDKLDTEGIEPLKYINEEDLPTLRKDIPHNPITHDDALKNAPEKDSDYFKVPKVIKK